MSAAGPTSPAPAAPDSASRWNPASVLPRLPGLLIGLALFGLGIAMMVRAGVGLSPWEVFHQGISRYTGIPLGTVSIMVGVPVLAAWFPLGERPGVGTILNILMIGSTTNLFMGLIPAQTDLVIQVPLMLAGVVTISVGSGMYLASDLGPGPRDGLMTGLHVRYGWSIRRARTSIELLVLLAGFLMGGNVGLGTVVFALGIGPLVQVTLPFFDRDGRVSRRRRQALEAEGNEGD